MNRRYSRLSPGAIGGVKLCGRAQVNPALSYQEAMNVALFGRQLAARLGESDPPGDTDFSYTLHDTVTGVTFRAYSAQSGPAYGGSPVDSFVDYDNDDYRIRQEVIDTLTAFEAWLTA